MTDSFHSRTFKGAATLAWLFSACMLWGCADQRESPRAGTSATASTRSDKSGRAPVSDDLMAFLSKARAAHHKADLQEAKEDLPGAIVAVRSIVAGPHPKTSPELREVLADAYARLADLESRVGNFDKALEEVASGLTQAQEVSHYRGHLFETKGLVHERRMAAYAAAGSKDKAAVEREAALAAFEQAIAIQDEVIQKLLPAPSPSALP